MGHPSQHHKAGVCAHVCTDGIGFILHALAPGGGRFSADQAAATYLHQTRPLALFKQRVKVGPAQVVAVAELGDGVGVLVCGVWGQVHGCSTACS